MLAFLSKYFYFKDRSIVQSLGCAELSTVCLFCFQSLFHGVDEGQEKKSIFLSAKAPDKRWQQNIENSADLSLLSAIFVQYKS